MRRLPAARRGRIVAGARAHGLPTDYLAWLEALPARPPDDGGG